MTMQQCVRGEWIYSCLSCALLEIYSAEAQEK
jgi:hypothetical protein